MKRVCLFLVANLFFYSLSFTQVAYKVEEESVMTISGTSTIHDWTSKVNEIKGEYIFKDVINDKKLPKSGSIIQQVRMVIPVLSIESPRGSVMDNKTYNALKSEEFPELIFEIKEDNVEMIISKEQNKLLLKTSGDLTLAGHTKAVTVDVEIQKLDDGKLKIQGVYPIDMTTYEIEPPSAMFGQIKTGKDVTIEFDLVLSEQ